eukprot:jgi/Astpho2/1673/Aster-x0488
MRSDNSLDPARLASNSSPPDRWGTAIGNLEDAKVSLATLAHAIEDAVYLDEDAFTQMQPVAQFQRTTQARSQPAHQQRIMELEHQLQETSTHLQASDAVRLAAEQRVQELTVELENNASAKGVLRRKMVFQLHYKELVAKNEELDRYKAIIDGLSGQR